LAGNVNMEYSIEIPGDVTDLPDAASITSSISNTQPATLTTLFTQQLQDAGVSVTITVQSIASPTVAVVEFTVTMTTTSTVAGISDDSSARHTIEIGVPSVLAILVAALAV